MQRVCYTQKQYDKMSAEQKSRFIPIDDESIVEMTELFDENPAIQAAASTMLRHVIAGGLQFKKKGFEMESPQSQRINQWWIRFVEDLWRSMWKYGFAIVTFEKIRVTGKKKDAYDLAPRVSEPELFDIKVDVTTRDVVYCIQPKDTKERDISDAPYYVFEDKAPFRRVVSRNGQPLIRIISTIRPLRRIDRIISQKIGDSAVASYRKARGVILTASVERSMSTLQMMNDYARSGDAKALDIEEQEKRSENFDQIMSDNISQIEDINQGQEAGLTEYGPPTRDPVTNGKMYPQQGKLWRYSHIPLPQGRTSVPGPVIEGPKDLLLFLQLERQEVGEQIGNPHDTQGGTGKSYQAVNMSLRMEQETSIHTYRSKTICVLEFIFWVIYSASNYVHSLSVRKEDEKKGKHVSDDDFIRDSHVSISFKAKPEMETLKELFELQAIDAKTFVEAIASKIGMDPSRFDVARLQKAQDYKLAAIKLEGTAPPKPVVSAAAPSVKKPESKSKPQQSPKKPSAADAKSDTKNATPKRKAQPLPQKTQVKSSGAKKKKESESESDTDTDSDSDEDTKKKKNKKQNEPSKKKRKL